MSYRTIWNHVEHLFGHRAEPLREALLSSVRAGRIILNTILSRNPGPVVAAVASILSVGQTSAAVEDPGAERLELNPLYDQFDYGSYTQLVTLGAGDANQMQSEFLARVYLPVPESVNPVTGQLEPTGLNPPYPVVLFVHGNHATCVDANGNATTSWMLPPSLPCGASGEEIANYAGYGYVGKLLAERGIAVVSISQNAINGKDTPDRPPNVREELIQEHLNYLISQASFSDQIDFQRVGLAGHSQGGSAVADHYVTYGQSSSNFQIRALLSIAPSSSFNGVNDIPAAALLGYCDGDAFDLNGLRVIDDARYVDPADQAPKFVVTLMGANHNFFNSEWTVGRPGGFDDADDDAFLGGDPYCDSSSPSLSAGRISALDQRAAARGYIAAFFRRYLLGEVEFDAYLDGELGPPPSANGALVHVDYHPAERDLAALNRLGEDESDEAPHEGAQNTLGGLVQYDPGLAIDWIGSTSSLNRTANSSRVHGIAMLKVSWSAFSGNVRQYVNELPTGKGDVSNFGTLQFRVAVDPDATGRFTEVPMRVRLTDTGGGSSFVWVSDYSDALFHPPSDYPASVLHTVRLPLDLFPGVDRTRLQAVALEWAAPSDQIFNGAGAVFLSDLIFSDEGLTVAEMWFVSSGM